MTLDQFFFLRHAFSLSQVIWTWAQIQCETSSFALKGILLPFYTLSICAWHEGILRLAWYHAAQVGKVSQAALWVQTYCPAWKAPQNQLTWCGSHNERHPKGSMGPQKLPCWRHQHDSLVGAWFSVGHKTLTGMLLFSQNRLPEVITGSQMLWVSVGQKMTRR